MEEIQCPQCNAIFQVNEKSYADILKQVRDKEFKHEIKSFKDSLEQKLEDTVSKVRAEEQKYAAVESVAKDKKIAEYQARMDNFQDKVNLAINKATELLKIEKSELKHANEKLIIQHKNEIINLKNNHKNQINFLDEEIIRIKEMKSRQSTKMIGESLEVHCRNSLNKIRASLFPNAYFEKDNKISRTNSKGDYIFRDYDEENNEIISIMFEMKNEEDNTRIKKKNDDFLKELDKDRQEKNCEFAVLVTLLEPENDLYNQGIVNVSYKYRKMYIIRPQFFIEIIVLLRDAAKNFVGLKKELALAKATNIDITNVEEQLEIFKSSFMVTSKNFSNNFQIVLDEIDKSINRLEKAKLALLKADKNLTAANKKVDAISIKKLIKNSPLLMEKFFENN
ncbi:DUF2130 domain-containing protein [Synechococcus sp. M16CYN]|uniref:DUF2130 domain-containing protein n=1 Tax=Synechococcus sp. M16CYN TaxID=3103139 RepID=UPI00324D0CD9